jgi:hypothetical protein
VLVVVGFIVSKREKGLGIFFIIVDSLIIFQYLALVAVTPSYWWQVLMLILGVMLCTFQLADR